MTMIDDHTAADDRAFRARIAGFEAAPDAPESYRAYLRLGNKTVWPNPNDPTEVQDRLRYGNPSQSDLLIAASVMRAYRELVALPSRRRSEIVRDLR